VKFRGLIFANLFRKKFRLILTIGSFAIALVLFTFLAVVKSAFSRGTEIAGADRLVVVSRIGLMQLMPGTWVELSVRYQLGLDPFDPKDNIMAGTAYVRELRNRFGSAGFLAAYHAGPTRYEQHLATGQLLPPETTAYVAAVTRLLGNEQVQHAAIRIKRVVLWREAPLFVERTEAR